MSRPAAVLRIEDPFGFARAAGRQGGEIAIAQLPRLADRLTDDRGAVSFAVRGTHDRQQRPMLELDVSGELRLRCDRCLAPMDYRLALQSQVLLAQPGAVPQDDDDPETPEWIEAGRDLDLAELVEDEILLGLPLSVRHDQEHCGRGKGGADRISGTDSPFSRLATLLKPERSDKR
ncbi:MAG: DUF177 domain-containing protein [Burkholderiales bacterium]